MKKNSNFNISLIVLLSIIFTLTLCVVVFKVDIQIALIFSIVIAFIGAKLKGGNTTSILESMKDGVNRGFIALVIFILIGALIGIWIVSGTVPALIYYGLDLINPKYFLPIGLIICSITSLATGTSWGTCGTVGVALMAMGMSIGIPAPIIAGMIVSGAFFGDKMSPLSDTTNLAAAICEVDLYDHIKAMLYTTIPAYIISLILYTVIGFGYGDVASINVESINTLRTLLSENFNINIFLLLPPVIVLILSFKKVSAPVGMFMGILSAMVLALIFQNTSFSEVLASLNSGYTKATGVALFDSLLIRGGIQSMMGTFSLSFLALCLGGILENFKILADIMDVLIGKIKRIPTLIATVLLSTFGTNLVMGEIYLGILINGTLFKKAFKERGLKGSMLSRLLEEGGTMTGGLIPWTTAGAFIAGVLGVPTLSYAPYAFLNILNPIISLLLCSFGISILKTKKTNNDVDIKTQNNNFSKY